MARARTRDQSPTQRQLRVGELLRHALANTLFRGEVHDSRLDGTPVTVSEVRMSPDLRHATAFVTPLGGSGGNDIIDALKDNSAYIRGQVSSQVNLKFSPRISFELATSFEHAAKIDGLLKGSISASSDDSGGE